MKDKSLYVLLGVPEDATDKEIRAAYLQKAKQYHPDKQAARHNAAASTSKTTGDLAPETSKQALNPNAATFKPKVPLEDERLVLHPKGSSRTDEKMRDLNHAYKMLSDPWLRGLHDSSLRSDRRERSGRESFNRLRAATSDAPSRISQMVDIEHCEILMSPNGDISFSYPCRCGNEYVLTQSQIEDEGKDTVACKGCSEVVQFTI